MYVNYSIQRDYLSIYNCIHNVKGGLTMNEPLKLKKRGDDVIKDISVRIKEDTACGARPLGCRDELLPKRAYKHNLKARHRKCRNSVKQAVQ